MSGKTIPNEVVMILGWISGCIILVVEIVFRVIFYYRIADLGSGSDHTGFYHRHGIASMDIVYYYDKVRINSSVEVRVLHPQYNYCQTHYWFPGFFAEENTNHCLLSTLPYHV